MPHLHRNSTLIRLDMFKCSISSKEGLTCIAVGVHGNKVRRFVCVYVCVKCSISGKEGLTCIAVGVHGNKVRRFMCVCMCVRLCTATR
jgi:hypothetical protein